MVVCQDTSFLCSEFYLLPDSKIKIKRKTFPCLYPSITEIKLEPKPIKKKA